MNPMDGNRLYYGDDLDILRRYIENETVISFTSTHPL